MHSITVSDSEYMLRFEKGENLLEVFQSFLIEKKIHSAIFSGLGSIESPTLAHYRVDTKKYSEKKLTGIFEVTNLTGSVALFEGKPLIHPHITLSDDDMHAFGGHLVGATISATLEVHIRVLPATLQKKFSEEIGLKLFDLPEKV